MENEAPEVVLITKKERDDLRRFNAEMRKILHNLAVAAQTVPLDASCIFGCAIDGVKILAEQKVAGFEE